MIFSHDTKYPWESSYRDSLKAIFLGILYLREKTNFERIHEDTWTCLLQFKIHYNLKTICKLPLKKLTFVGNI